MACRASSLPNLSGLSTNIGNPFDSGDEDDLDPPSRVVVRSVLNFREQMGAILVSGGQSHEFSKGIAEELLKQLKSDGEYWYKEVTCAPDMQKKLHPPGFPAETLDELTSSVFFEWGAIEPGNGGETLIRRIQTDNVVAMLRQIRSKSHVLLRESNETDWNTGGCLRGFYYIEPEALGLEADDRLEYCYSVTEEILSADGGSIIACRIVFEPQ